MDYQGRSLVVDPDVFCISNVNELLRATCRALPSWPATAPAPSSGLGLERHAARQCEAHPLERAQQLRGDVRLRARLHEMDHAAARAAGSIAPLEEVWNDFDRLTPETRMIHNTKRQTQPWKSGLPVDFRAPESATRSRPRTSTTACAEPVRRIRPDGHLGATPIRTRSACSSACCANADLDHMLQEAVKCCLPPLAADGRAGLNGLQFA